MHCFVLTDLGVLVRSCRTRAPPWVWRPWAPRPARPSASCCSGSCKGCSGRRCRGGCWPGRMLPPRSPTPTPPAQTWSGRSCTQTWVSPWGLWSPPGRSRARWSLWRSPAPPSQTVAPPRCQPPTNKIQHIFISKLIWCEGKGEMKFYTLTQYAYHKFTYINRVFLFDISNINTSFFD